jgi:hypothetical protein
LAVCQLIGLANRQNAASLGMRKAQFIKGRNWRRNI